MSYQRSRSGRLRAGRFLIGGTALVALVACTTPTAPTPPSQPTVQAAATTVSAAASPLAATAGALASPAAATAGALASPVAGTAQAIAGTAVAVASPMATALASPSPSPGALMPGRGPVSIADASLADATPWVSLRNDTDASVDLAGWRLEVGTASATLPDDAVLQPREAITLHAGEGMDDDRSFYLGAAGETLVAAAQPGTRVRLLDDDGRVMAETTVPRVL